MPYDYQNKEGENLITLYYDGKIDSTIVVEKDIIGVKDEAKSATYLGFEPSTSTIAAYHYEGRMDDVYFYNKVLSSDEVGALAK